MSEAASLPVGRKRDGLRDKLLALILSGELAGGARLNELELSRKLKTSRTPLREALLHLEREGLVRSDLRRGFSVEPLSTREVREIYPILGELECLAVRTSARFLPPILPELARINSLFARARTAPRARALDTRWHDTLMSPSKNARLASIVSGMRRAIARYERLYMADRDLIGISAIQHAAILAALERGDLDAALELLRDNYLFGMQALLQKMGEQ